MRKLSLISLFCILPISPQAFAEKPIVIDSQTLGEPTTPPSETDISSTTGAAPSVQSNADANKERVLKGGRMSWRQRAAVGKAELSASNLEQEAAFLVANQAKPGVVSLPSGVQYKILKTGKGNKPKDDSVVVCRYKGTLIDGTQFEADANQPVALPVSIFVSGLKEAVKLMSVGSKWQIVVPPQLAYGDQGNRGVGPNAVLIYELEIISLK